MGVILSVVKWGVMIAVAYYVIGYLVAFVLAIALVLWLAASESAILGDY
jgi:hypothetical protein